MKMIMLLLMMFADAGAAATPDVQLLDFTASYCQPCQQMLPILQKMERDHFPIRRIDITEEHGLAQQFKVDRIPTLVLLVEGKEVKRFVGLTDESELRSEMNRAARRLSEARQDSNPQAAPSQRPPDQAGDGVRTADVSLSGGDRPSLKEIFRGLIGGGASPGEFEYPAVRGQSPDQPRKLLQGLQAAAAATVRVRVAGISTKDGKKVQDVGTGTIVYSATGQAIVLTCAHIFLDIATNDAAVEVEVFEEGKVNPYRATLIGGDHNSDLALLKFQTSKILPSVRLTQLTPKAEKGQALVSFGCNGGENPTQLDTRLVDINRYDGPPNLVCTTDPKSGRSGGGLFNTSGDLVGVCSCADRKRQEGLYMAHTSILALVSKQNLLSILKATPTGGGEDAASSFADLLEGKPTAEANAVDPAAVPASPGRVAQIEPPTFDQAAAPVATDPGSTQEALVVDAALSEKDSFGFGPGSAPTTRSAAGSTARTGPEVMIVIDDKKPGSEKRVIIIPQASPWMMELLTGESDDGTPTSTTAALRPSTVPSSARTPEMPSKRRSETRSLIQAP